MSPHPVTLEPEEPYFSQRRWGGFSGMKDAGWKIKCGRKAGWERLQAGAQRCRPGPPVPPPRPLGHRVDSCMPLPGGSPDGSVVKNLPAHPGRHGFDPRFRKMPHASEQLSLGATTLEPVHWSPGAAPAEARVPQSSCPATKGAPEMRSPRTASPCLSQREKPMQQLRPSMAKSN